MIPEIITGSESLKYPEGVWAQILDDGTVKYIPRFFYEEMDEDKPIYSKQEDGWIEADMADVVREKHLNHLGLNHTEEEEGSWAQFKPGGEVKICHHGRYRLDPDKPIYRKVDGMWVQSNYEEVIINSELYTLSHSENMDKHKSGDWAQFTDEGVTIWMYPEYPTDDFDKERTLYYLDGDEWIVWTEELERSRTEVLEEISTASEEEVKDGPEYTSRIGISTPERLEPEYTGASVSYYTVWIENPTTEGREPYHAECNDIIEALNMSYAEGNAFKALWRRAAARQGLQKKGYDNGLYDAEKVEFFGRRLVEQSK